MLLTGRQTQFYIDVIYGAVFAAGFSVLLFGGMDARVAAFQGGLVFGYFLRVWENMSVYERILQEEVAAEAEEAVAAEAEQAVAVEAEEAVADEAHQAVVDEAEDTVAREVAQQVPREVTEEIGARLPAEVTAEVQRQVTQEIAAEIEDQVREEVARTIDDELTERLGEHVAGRGGDGAGSGNDAAERTQAPTDETA